MRRLLATLATLTATALVVTACGDDSGADDAAPTGSAHLSPAAKASPQGTQRMTCDLDTADGPQTFALDLPDGFAPGALDDDSVDCSWDMSVRVGKGRDAYETNVVVSVTTVSDDDPSIQEIYDDQEDFNVDDGAPQGDDSTSDVVLEKDVAVFGDATGTRLGWDCFCDGQGNLTRIAQVADVRVTWRSASELADQTDQQLDAALAGAGTVG